MNQVQSILTLMKHDLNASQLAKLQSVLEAVLSVQKDLPPIDDLIRRFETSKRLMGIKDTSLCQYTLEVRMLAKNLSKPLNQLTTTDIKDYLSRYRSEHSISMVTIQNKLRFLSSFFEFMLDDGYITKNPIKGIGRILVEKRRFPQRVIYSFLSNYQKVQIYRTWCILKVMNLHFATCICDGCNHGC